MSGYITAYALVGLLTVGWSTYEAVKRGDFEADIVASILMCLFWPVPVAGAIGAMLGDVSKARGRK